MVSLSLPNHIPIRPLNLLVRNVGSVSKTRTDTTVKMNQYEKFTVRTESNSSQGKNCQQATV